MCLKKLEKKSRQNGWNQNTWKYVGLKEVLKQRQYIKSSATRFSVSPKEGKYGPKRKVRLYSEYAAENSVLF